jgi:signal transduction histidine kinase
MVQDSLAAAGLSAVALAGTLTHLHVEIPASIDEVIRRRLDGWGIVLILLQTMTIAWRRKAPVTILAVTGGAFLAYSFRGYAPSLATFGFMAALYTVAAHRDRPISIPAGVAAVAALATLQARGRPAEASEAIIAETFILGAAWFLGDAMRIRRGQVVQLEDRASRLEREREERAQQAVAQERRVIARELHDVVAHNVSVIVAQAGASQRIFDSHPEEARAAIRAIEHTGREALVEMRRLTGFLRTEDDGTLARSPQPGLRDVPALVAQVEDAGVAVEYRVEGPPRALPAGLDLSAFRIVQEALTNVIKHAGAARATVVVRYSESRLEIRVTDDGLGPPGGPGSDSRPRYGHLGMRERVALFGGELRVGPGPGGGYQVIVSLGLEGEPS